MSPKRLVPYTFRIHRDFFICFIHYIPLTTCYIYSLIRRMILHFVVIQNRTNFSRVTRMASVSIHSETRRMGKALPHGADLLDILPKSYNIYGVNNTDFREFENKFLKNTLTSGSMSMDRRLEQFNRASVRMAMLKHEEIFKEQVRELHRLYRVQKMLMNELRNNATKLHSPTNPSPRTALIGGKCIEADTRTGFWTTIPGSETNPIPFGSWNHHNNSNQSSSGYNFHPLLSKPRPDPNLQEQSSSCSRDTSKMPKGFDLEQPAEEISTDISATHNQLETASTRPSKDNTNIDSSCNPYFCKDGENEVELTLSIGFGASKNKPKNRKPHRSQELGCSSSSNYESRQLEPSLSVRSDRGEESGDPANSAGSGSGSATCDRESMQQQPPWLLQALSLNRT